MNKNIFILMGIIGAISITGCTKDFGDINTNPNEPTAVSTGFLLTNAQKSIMDQTNNSFWGSRRGMQLSQYWSSNQYSNESRYQLRTEVTNSSWNTYYAGALENLQNIIDQNTGDNAGDVAGYGANENQIAVATILQVWIYQQLTDAFGAVPMTEALQGSANTTPTYDSQSSVYASLLSNLDNALTSMDASAMGPQGDQIYGGDMNAWATFANSLKLRVAMRISDVDAGTAQGAAEEAAAAGCITSNAGNALFGYLSGAPNNNPINEDKKTRNDFAASNTMIDHMTTTVDPRMSIYYAAAVADGTFVGEVYGLDETNAALTPDDAVSQRGDAVLAADFPGIFMDAAQVNFLLAEGAARGWSMGGTGADYFAAANAASMEFWGVEQGDADDYATRNPYDACNWKNSIGTSKWVALYMQGQEGWAEVRRLDAPTLNACADGQLDGGDGVPTRMMYPLDEQTLNNSSWDAGVADNGGDDSQQTKLWWDVN